MAWAALSAITAILIGIYLAIRKYGGPSIDLPVSGRLTTQLPVQPFIPSDPVTSGVNTVEEILSGVSTAVESGIKKFAAAIQQFEGYLPTHRSVRNNNPGNLKYSAWEDKYGVIGTDDKGFAIFDTFEGGWNALLDLINRRIRQHPEWSILDFFMVYAPPSDNNPTNSYAEFVAKQLGVSVDTKIGDLS